MNQGIMSGVFKKIGFNSCHTLLLLTGLVLAACTPRDVKVVDDATRAKINKYKIGSFKKNATAGFSLETFPLAAFLIEKQNEAIELAKLATGSLDPMKSQYKVENSNSDEIKIQESQKQVRLTSNGEAFDYVIRDQPLQSKNKKSFSVNYSESELGIESLVVKGEGNKSTVEYGGSDKNFVSLTEDIYQLNFDLDKKESDLLRVNLKIDGALVGARGAASISNKISVNLKMIISRSSLKTQDVKVLSTSATINYPGFNGKTFSVTLEGANLVMNADGLCFASTGAFNATAGPKNKFVMNSESQQFTVAEKKWASVLVLCGKRPTVDLSRFLAN
jgi:hypothetical protein